jgi:hypothetical protein
LPVNVGGEERLSHAVMLLTQIATPPPAPDTAFRRVGRARCEAELKALGKSAETLVRAISNLHRPTILALAAPPASWMARGELKRLAQQAAAAAFRANVSDVERASKVQPRNRASPMVADILADEYERITGKRPTVRTRDGIAYGPFFELVRDIFIAMGFRDSPEVASRNALRYRQKSRKGSAHPASGVC